MCLALFFVFLEVCFQRCVLVLHNLLCDEYVLVTFVGLAALLDVAASLYITPNDSNYNTLSTMYL
jgi:hypothetical protein